MRSLVVIECLEVVYYTVLLPEVASYLEVRGK